MCVTGMTSTGSACPSQGEWEERWCTEEPTATGDQGQDFTQDADFLSLPSLHSFYIITLPARHPGDCSGGSRARCLCTHTAARGCKWKMLFSSQHNPHTMVPSTPIQTLKCWAWAIIPVELECRRAAVAVTHPAIHYTIEVWPTSLCFLTPFRGAAFSLFNRTSVPHRP